jgi:hypothetical protein
MKRILESMAGRAIVAACLAFVFSFSLSVSVLAATTVGNNVAVGGTLDVTGITTLTAALVANGAVTLGDSVGDSITITGKLGTIYVSDGSTTSTHAKNSLTLGEATNYNKGVFYVDSSGNVSASGTLAVIGNTTLTANLTVDTDTLYVDSSNNKVGVVSSTPFAQLSIGAGGAVSSTISVGKFCMYAGQENGVNVYVKLGANQAANQPFATTTVSCF